MTTARAALVEAVTLVAEATELLAGGGEATDLAVLHDRLADPVDGRVATDGGVAGVDHDDLEELEGAVLSDGVGVEDAEVHAVAGSALLSEGTEGAGAGHAEDPLTTGLAPDDATVSRPSAATTADADAGDAVALLGLVAETASLVGTGGVVGAVDAGKLTKLPAADALDKAHDIGLLASPELRDETVCTHLYLSLLSFGFYISKVRFKYIFNFIKENQLKWIFPHIYSYWRGKKCLLMWENGNFSFKNVL